MKNFKENLDEDEIGLIKDVVSDVIDSLVKLNQEEFTAEDVRELVGEMDWASKVLFSILFINDELCGCDDHDEHDNN